MTANDDQLTQLGQQVLDAIAASYTPTDDTSLALALYPGQSLDSDILQGGVTNQLRLSNWLGNQYDYPLWLKLADGTPLVTSAMTGVTAKSAYATMAQWCEPGVAADSPEFPRISALIAQARRDLGGDPETLPFSCEPGDFGEDTCSGWQVFDTVITAHTDQSSQPPPGPPPRRILVNPELWKLRTVSDDVLSELPARQMVAEQSRSLSAELPALSRVLAVDRISAVQVTAAPPITPPTIMAMMDVAPVANMAIANVDRLGVDRLGVGQLGVDQTGRGRIAVVRRPTDPVLEPLPAPPQLTPDGELARQLVHVNLEDLVTQPAVSTATTSDSSLHVHFEHILLTITRQLAGTPWWHPELLAEPCWFVPGMKSGAMVPLSADPAYAHCLPLSLLLVRNVSLTGTWSTEARSAMNSGVHFFGPFLMAPTTQTTDSDSTEQTTVLGLGVQVIGELGGPLPALPPMDDPATGPAGGYTG